MMGIFFSFRLLIEAVAAECFLCSFHFLASLFFESVVKYLFYPFLGYHVMRIFLEIGGWWSSVCSSAATFIFLIEIVVCFFLYPILVFSYINWTERVALLPLLLHVGCTPTCIVWMLHSTLSFFCFFLSAAFIRWTRVIRAKVLSAPPRDSRYYYILTLPGCLMVKKLLELIVFAVFHVVKRKRERETEKRSWTWRRRDWAGGWQKSDSVVDFSMS